jgi:hypothetical protein
MIMAGLTLGVAIAKTTLVAELRIKQFWAIPLADKVVSGPCMMAMPLFLFFYEGSPTLTHGRFSTSHTPQKNRRMSQPIA